LPSVGLPGTSGFVGEFLVMLGVFKSNMLVSAFVATGVVLGAAYMIWLYKRVVYGEIVNNDIKKLEDVTNFEKLTLIPLALLVILYGIFPNYITDVTGPAVKNLLLSYGVN